MTKWTMIEKRVNSTGRAVRTKPAVIKGKSGNARLVLPGGTTDFLKANIYSDGGTRLAFHFCDSGKYSVMATNKSSKARTVSIPSQYAAFIPAGTTDAVLTREGDFHVLDLYQLARLGIAA